MKAEITFGVFYLRGIQMSISYPDNTASRSAIPASGLTDSTLIFDVISGGERSLSLAELKKTGVQVINVKQYGAVGDGVADDTLAIQQCLDIVSSGNISLVFFPVGQYNISDNLSVYQNTSIVGESKGGVTISGVGGYRTLSTVGSISELKATLTESGIIDARSLTINNSSGLNVGDWIVIVAASGEDDNASKSPQRELNKVSSINSGTSIGLVYPLQHSYPYSSGYATPASIYQSTCIENISIKNLKFLHAVISFGYNNNLNIECDIVNGVITSIDTASKNCNLKVNIDNAIAGAGDSANAFIYGLSKSNLCINTYGGFKDGIRMRGCSNCLLICDIFECVERGIWLYKCNNIDIKNSSIIGSQSISTNLEGLLFDYCNDCFFQGKIKEINKVGLYNCIEFRGTSKRCNVYKTQVYSYTNQPLIVKFATDGCSFKEGYIEYNSNSGTNIIDWQNDGGTPGSFSLEDNRIISMQTIDSLVLFRSTSSTEISVSNTATLAIKNNIFERGSGYIVLLGGTGSGTALHRLIVSGNHSITDNTVSGAPISISLPITQAYISNNTIVAASTSRQWLFATGPIDYLYFFGNNGYALNVGSNVTNLYIGSNALTQYTIPLVSQLKAGILALYPVVGFSSISGGMIGTTTVTWSGITTSDNLCVTPPSTLHADLIANGYINATNTITLKLLNTSATPIVPPSGTWKLAVIKP